MATRIGGRGQRVCARLINLPAFFQSKARNLPLKNRKPLYHAQQNALQIVI